MTQSGSNTIYCTHSTFLNNKHADISTADSQTNNSSFPIAEQTAAIYRYIGDRYSLVQVSHGMFFDEVHEQLLGVGVHVREV